MGLEPAGHASECAAERLAAESFRWVTMGRCRRLGVDTHRKPKKASSDSADGEAGSNTADQLRSATQ